MHSGQMKLSDTMIHYPKISLTVSEKLAIVLDDKCTNKKDTAYLTIQLLKPSKIANKFKDTLVCVGNKILRVGNSIYPSNNYQWQWLDISNNIVLSKSDTLNYAAISTSRIKLTLTNGCTIDSSFFTVFVNPPLKAEIISNTNFLIDTTICYGEMLNLKPYSSGGFGIGYNWEWLMDGKIACHPRFIFNAIRYIF